MAETRNPGPKLVEDARRHPLSGWKDPQTGATGLRVVGWRTLMNLRGRPEEPAFLAAARQAIGFDLPLTANRWSGSTNRVALWLGPDEWLIQSPDGEAAELERQLRHAADGVRVSVVDVSHQYCGFELAGPAAREILAKGCPLDLHPRTFPPDGCAQSLLGRIAVLLRALPLPDAFELWFRNSFARYAARWLADAMAEFSAD